MAHPSSIGIVNRRADPGASFNPASGDHSSFAPHHTPVWGPIPAAPKFKAEEVFAGDHPRCTAKLDQAFEGLFDAGEPMM
jgi:hypothetical protein